MVRVSPQNGSKLTNSTGDESAMFILSDFTELLGKFFEEMCKDTACICLWGKENEFETHYRHSRVEMASEFKFKFHSHTYDTRP